MTHTHAAGKGQTIFIVDDDAYFNKLLMAMVVRICNRNGIHHEIHSFSNGESCMKEIGLQPSLVLLDFYLDTSNDITATAYDMLHDIKEQLPRTYVLLISQKEDWSLFKDDLIAAGADNFLHKGRDLDEKLESIIKEVLTSSSVGK